MQPLSTSFATFFYKGATFYLFGLNYCNITPWEAPFLVHKKNGLVILRITSPLIYRWDIYFLNQIRN
jgi:hypothetical protein